MKTSDRNDRPVHNKSNTNRNVNVNDKKSEFKELMKGVRGHKVGGKDICLWYNLRPGCSNNKCERAHVCANIPRNRTDPCKGRHSKKDCRS